MNDTQIEQSLLKANLLRLQKEYKAALKLYISLAETCPIPELYAVISSCYREIAAVEEAEHYYQNVLDWLEKAIECNPENGLFYALKGEIYSLELLDYQKAIEAYRIAIAKKPNDAWILSSAAGLYGVPDDVVTLDEAIEWMEACIVIAPSEGIYRARLGSLYKEAGHIQDMKIQLIAALLLPQPIAGTLLNQIDDFIDAIH